MERVGWKDVHAQLVRLARSKGEHDYEEGRWLLEAQRQRVHLRLGYGSVHEYAEWLFGYSPRFVAERLRVAEALEGLPQLTAALRQGSFAGRRCAS